MKKLVVLYFILLLSFSIDVFAAGINDTGADQCTDQSTLALTSECTGSGQDGEFGRDVVKKSPKDGRVGFSFRKVCNSGELSGNGSCPASPKLGKNPNEWGCTRDNVTGLMWEVKRDDGGYRDKDLLYTNYQDGRAGSALAFVVAVNNKTLCGLTNQKWRLPTRSELQGIADYGILYPGPVIDAKWFPNTVSWAYWTSEKVSDRSYTIPVAFGVNFFTGSVSIYSSDGSYFNLAVRLVRDISK